MRPFHYLIALAAISGFAMGAPADAGVLGCVDCVDYCCSTHGGCNFLNCAGSTCKCGSGDHCYCECDCHYG